MIFGQIIPLFIEINLTPHKYFEKIKWWSGQISEIEQNHVINDALGPKQVMLSIQNCKIVPLLMLNNFTPHKYFVKIKSSCSKRRWSSIFSETEQQDANKLRHRSKTRHGIKKIFSKSFLWSCWTTLSIINIS